MKKCENFFNYHKTGAWFCLSSMEHNKKYDMIINGKHEQVMYDKKVNHFVIFEEIKND